MKKLMYILLALSLVSCGKGQSKQKSGTNSIVTDSIIKYQCKKNPSNTYWFYKPKGANEQTPVMVFFDPHGDGRLPLGKYKAVADSLNYIFVGSNGTHNGMEPNEIEYVIQTLFTDLNARININLRPCYLCGFSGGARIAGLLTTSSSMFKGVIAMGASLGLSESTQNTSAHYVELIGIRDFNYVEVFLSRKISETLPIKSSFITFDGKHEWAPLSFFQLAVLSLNSDNESRKIRAITDTLIMRTTNDVVLQDNYYKLALSIQKNNSTELTEAYNSFNNSTSARHVLETYYKQITDEQYNQQALVDAYKTKDYGWWNNKLEVLEKGKRSEVIIEARHNERLLNYVSMLGYMFTGGALSTGNTALAQQYLKIYKRADPKNPDVVKFEKQIGATQ